MKKIKAKPYLLVMITSIAISIQAQNDVVAMRKNLNTIDSLNKKIQLALNSFEKKGEGYLLNDSLFKLNNKLTNLDRELLNSKNEITVLKKDLEKSNILKIKALESSINTKSDSINLLRNEVAEKGRQLNMSQEKAKKDISESFKAGGQKKMDDLVNFYSNSFDSLTVLSCSNTCKRDLNILGDYGNQKDKILNLLIYFETSIALANNLDSIGILNYRSKLKVVMSNSAKARDLDSLLSDYILYKRSLSSLLNKIKIIDDTITADGFTHFDNKKRSLISWEITNFMYNYSYFVRYEYLKRVFFELIDRKFYDPDQSIKDLITKLND
jgi:hypothetical protein